MDGSCVDYCDVFISCSFWRHPFTAEEPLVSKWCDAMKNQTPLHLGCPESQFLVHFNFWVNNFFEVTYNTLLNINVIIKLTLTCAKVNTVNKLNHKHVNIWDQDSCEWEWWEARSERQTDSVSVCVGAGVALEQPESEDQNKSIDSDVHGELQHTKLWEGDEALVFMLVCLHSVKC